MQAAYPANMEKSQRPIRRIRQARMNEAAKLAGSQAALGLLLGIKKPYINAICNGKRDLGDELANRIEDALEKPRGWMDSDPEAQPWPFATVDRERFNRLPLERRIEIEIRIRDLIDVFEASMRDQITAGSGSPRASSTSPPRVANGER